MHATHAAPAVHPASLTTHLLSPRLPALFAPPCLLLTRLLEDKRHLQQQLTVAQLSHSQHSTVHTDELHSLRNELLLRTKLCDDHTDSLTAAQQQLKTVRAQLEKAAERERDMERQLGYMEEQRRELQRQVEEMSEQLGEWREREKERKWLRKQLDDSHGQQQHQTQQLVPQHTHHSPITHTRSTSPSHLYHRCVRSCVRLVAAQRDKEQALAYVEREVRQLQQTFDTTQQHHSSALQQLHDQLHAKASEAAALTRELEAVQQQLAERERLVGELQGRAAAAEGRVVSVEGEMRYLLNEMATRQKLANQLAQTLTILP